MKIFDLFNGDRMVTYGDYDFISNSIKKHKCWEPNVTDTFLNILKKYQNPIVLDVGCNIGYFSIISSQQCKQIFSFDANINNINILNESLIINNIQNIQPIHSCISDNDNIFYKITQENEKNIGSLQVIECNESESNVSTIILDNFINKEEI